MNTVYVKTELGEWLDIGQPVSMTFEMCPIDGSSLDLLFGRGLMKFKVGDIVTRTRTASDTAFRGMPVGTVLRDPEGKTRVLNDIKNDTWLFTDKGGAGYGEYTVLLLPEPVQPSEVETLAEELWDVRCEAAAVAGDYSTFGWYDTSEDHRDVYRALAKHVLGKYEPDHDAVVVDNEGDTWYRGPNGNYSQRPDNATAGWTLGELNESYGPLKAAE